MKKIFFTIFVLLFLLTSCNINENIEPNYNQNTGIKNEENLPNCSELAEGSNEQCSIDITDDSEEKEICKNSKDCKENFCGMNNLTNECVYIGENNNLNSNQENMKKNYQTELPKNGDLVAIMKTTNGTMKIRLFENDVPTIVNNFIGLASEGYYNGIIFHRVINNFMIQGGDPTGTGMGGESIYGAKFDDEFSEKLSNIRGSISMANAGPNTNGSQFFINQKDNINLDFDKEPLTSKHAVFGQVYEGIENVDKIAKTKTGENDKPEKDIKIISLEIKQMENGKLVDYKVDKNKYIEEYNKKQEEKKEANKNREVKSGDKIKVEYTLKLEDGAVFDTSVGKSPFEFIVGVGQVIPGFDNGVIGMKIGDKKTLNIEPKDGYGEYDENNRQVLKLSDLGSFIDAGIKIEIGAILPTMYGNFKIIDVSGEDVTIDTNSELAGKNLIFDIELLDFVN